jgi:hypothetical protein
MVHFFSFWKAKAGARDFFGFFPLLPMCSHQVPKCSQIWFPRCPTLLGAGCKEIANDSSWQKAKFWFTRKWQWRFMKHKKIFYIYCVTEASRWVRSPWVRVKINKIFKRRVQSMHKTNGQKKKSKNPHKGFFFLFPRHKRTQSV